MPDFPWGISSDQEMSPLHAWLAVGHNNDGSNKGGGGSAAGVTFTPAGNISATDVQGALEEVDSEKAATADLLAADNATLEASGSTLRIRQPVSTFIELAEMADPAAPSANEARLYVRDNGAGKTQLVVVFPTGSVQVIATEP